jgi:recombination protein RecA
MAKGKKKITASQLDVMLEAREYLQKRHGQGSIIGMDEIDSTIPGYISTQSLAIDALVGNGGLPQSRLIEIFGPEGAGKSTIADHVFAEVQRHNGQTYLWDTENARETKYIDRIGIVRKLASQIEATTLEEGFEVMADTISWHAEHYPDVPGVIVWDTVASTATANELDPDKKDEAFGPAKIIRGNLRKLVLALKRSRWMLIAVNQEYEQTKNYLTIRKTYGGGGIPYHSSIRLSVWPGTKLYGAGGKDSGLPPIGQVVSIRSVKNKVASPWRRMEAAIVYGEGIDNTWTIFDTLKGAGLITSGGGWYSLDLPGKFPKWQTGFLGLKECCRQDPDLWGVLLEAYRGVMHG